MFTIFYLASTVFSANSSLFSTETAILATNNVPATTQVLQTLYVTCFLLNAICISGYVNATNLYLTIDVNNALPWAAVGFGTQMNGSDVLTSEIYNQTLSVRSRKPIGHSSAPIVTNVSLCILSHQIIQGRRIAKITLPLTPTGPFTHTLVGGLNNIISAYGLLNNNGFVMYHIARGVFPSNCF